MNAVTLYTRPSALDSVFADMDGWVDSFFGRDPFLPAASAAGPAVDIRETEDAYLLEADLPGFDEKNVEVNVEGRTLSIESKKEEAETEKSEGSFVLRERSRRTFTRSFLLPEDAAAESIEAVFKNGVLSIRMAKKPEAKRRAVEIQVR